MRHCATIRLLPYIIIVMVSDFEQCKGTRITVDVVNGIFLTRPMWSMWYFVDHIDSADVADVVDVVFRRTQRDGMGA